MHSPFWSLVIYLIQNSTLSGVLRSGADKSTVIAYKDKFARIAHRVRLPNRDQATYPDVLRKLHAAILGMIATLQAYPYVVEVWMPALIERLARHASDPQPVSTAIRKFAAEFKKTHQVRADSLQVCFLLPTMSCCRTHGTCMWICLTKTNPKLCRLSLRAPATVSTAHAKLLSATLILRSF